MTVVHIVSAELRADLERAVHKYQVEKNLAGSFSKERQRNCDEIILEIKKDHENSEVLIAAVRGYCDKNVLTGFTIGGFRFSTGRSYLLRLINEVFARYSELVYIRQELAVAREKLNRAEMIELLEVQSELERVTGELAQERRISSALRAENLDLRTQIAQLNTELSALTESMAGYAVQVAAREGDTGAGVIADVRGEARVEETATSGVRGEGAEENAVTVGGGAATAEDGAAGERGGDTVEHAVAEAITEFVQAPSRPVDLSGSDGEGRSLATPLRGGDVELHSQFAHSAF